MSERHGRRPPAGRPPPRRSCATGRRRRASSASRWPTSRCCCSTRRCATCACARSEVETPLETAEGRRLADEIVVVAILRAGLGHGRRRAAAGARGARRPPRHVPRRGVAPARRLLRERPADAEDAEVVVVDPMLATGGSAVNALARLKDAGAQRLRFVCLVAAPEGLDAVAKAHPDVPITCAAVDRAARRARLHPPRAWATRATASSAPSSRGRAYGVSRARAKSSASNGRRSSSCSPMPISLTGMLELVGDRERDPALGRAVELGQHDPRDVDGLAEQLGLAHAVLAGRGVDGHQRLVRRVGHLLGDHAPDLRELLHQVVLRVQAPGRVDHDHVGAALTPARDRVEGDRAGVGALAGP